MHTNTSMYVSQVRSKKVMCALFVPSKLAKIRKDFPIIVDLCVCVHIYTYIANNNVVKSLFTDQMVDEARIDVQVFARMLYLFAVSLCLTHILCPCVCACICLCIRSCWAAFDMFCY